MERQTNDQLAKNGLVAELVYKTSKVKEAELANRRRDRTKAAGRLRTNSIEPQLASKQAAVDQAKQLAKLKAGPSGSVACEAPACRACCNSCRCKSASG